MSSYREATKITHKIEGGYCYKGECGSAKSGETYRGIDRNYHPKWTGWAVIDTYKKQYNRRPKYNEVIGGQLGEMLNVHVEAFYDNYWRVMGLTEIKNNTLGALVFAFLIHRQYAGIATLNTAAIAAGVKPSETNKLKITPAVAAYYETNLNAGYSAARTAIVGHYNRIKNGITYIKNRVNIFPVSLDEIPPPPKAVEVGALGLFFSQLHTWLFGRYV